jgi:hypothetical protein
VVLIVLVGGLATQREDRDYRQLGAYGANLIPFGHKKKGGKKREGKRGGEKGHH